MSIVIHNSPFLPQYFIFKTGPFFSSKAVLKELKVDQDEIIIGRDAGNDIQIDNIAVSREHAKICRGPNYYFIEDLNSTNGIFINGKKSIKSSLRKMMRYRSAQSFC